MHILESVNLFERIIEFLSYEMTNRPQMYGWFHLLFLGLMVFGIIFLIYKFKGSTTKEMDMLLRTVAGVLLFMEIYKQLVFSVDNGVWRYQWYAFPFQFCSVPMYIMFLVSFLKPGKVKSALYAFLATFSLFAGLAVMFYPVDVFINTLGISIQTMVHHGLMAVIGIVLLATGHVATLRKNIIPAAIVFFLLGAFAFVLNILFRNVDGTFNMFFIGPFHPTHLPILTLIQSEFGYIPFLFSYFFGFNLLAYIVMLGDIFVDNVIISVQTQKSIFSHRRTIS